MPHPATEPEPWLAALTASHRQLVARVETLDDDALRQPSYCDEWTVAQVLSHLGSGAEIFGAILDAVLAGAAPPGRDTFPAVWERWDARAPEEQATAFVAADGQLLGSLGGAVDRLGDLRIPLFGSLVVDGAGFIAMRLNEHALHSWDVAVTFDPGARLQVEPVRLLVDRLPDAGGRGHAESAGDQRPVTAVVATSEPARTFRVRVDDGVHIDETSSSAPAADLRLPAEAALRLVAGRLDDAHQPPVDPGERAVLDLLRRVFPGY